MRGAMERSVRVNGLPMDDDPPESSSRSEESETRDAPTSFDFEDINPWAIVAGDRPSPWPRPTWPSAPSGAPRTADSAPGQVNRPIRVRPSVEAGGAQAGDQGPCLYFGPAGQRCSRRALPGGFCAIHRPGAKAIVKSSTKPTKIIAAIIGMVGVLWPFLVDIIREIARWLHSH
jgi:hypothetical protein